MSEAPTQKAHAGLAPVKALSVQVLEGPDQGASCDAAEDTITIGTAAGNDLRLQDPTVSRYHLELRHRARGVQVVDLGSTNGTLCGGVRVERGQVAAGALLDLGTTKIRVHEGAAVNIALLQAGQLGRLRGDTPLMRRLMAQAERVARSEAAVLLVGESGTGKELIAEAIHSHSARNKEPFVVVDCGALSPTLIASELFGHEKGAFTGADRQHVGAFERASGGTLFLDEIGELPSALQTPLLGVLERKRFRRVGGDRELEADVRVVAATNRDLRAEVNSGAFRLDLYYRIAVVVLSVPALRERADDIPLLFEHFLREAGHTDPLGRFVSARTLEQLKSHRWPGNVRELRNLVEATLAMGAPQVPGQLEQARVEDTGQKDMLAPLLEFPYKDARRKLLGEFERRYVERCLAQAEGNVSKAARDSKMDRSYLIDLLRRYGLR